MSDYCTTKEGLQIIGQTPLVSWSRSGFIPKNEKGNLSVQFLLRLKEYAGDTPPTRQHAQLCWLEWLSSYGTDQEKVQVRKEVADLLNSKTVLTSIETAAILGFHPVTVFNWMRKQFLPGVHVTTARGTTCLFLPKDVYRIRDIMNSLTSYEVADQLGVNLSSVNRLVRKGKLKATETPGGRRFNPRDVAKYLKRQDQKGVPSPEAWKILGVPEKQLLYWGTKGAVAYVEKKRCRYYDETELLKLKKELELLRGGFDWLAATHNDASYSLKQVVKRLGVSRDTIMRWTQEGLLPYFDLGPQVLARQQHREYVASYVDSLAAYATARSKRVTKRLACEYKQHSKEQHEESHLERDLP